MTIAVSVIRDSISPEKVRLTTLQLRYPHFIHAELMTHRVFSRNASSSRAIPVKRLIGDIREDTAMPFHWGKNQPGMQAHEEWKEKVIVPYWAKDILGEAKSTSMYMTREDAWKNARDNAIAVAQAFHEAGYHKQIVNRLLEPFSHINVLVTSTYWRNFIALRNHADAQPEIRILAEEIQKILETSMPILTKGWHLPYMSMHDMMTYSPNELIRCSVARCARVSYLTAEKERPTKEQDLKLYDRLLSSSPLHASPAEHIALPDWRVKYEKNQWANPQFHGNFVGWQQYRKMLRNEAVMEDFND